MCFVSQSQEIIIIIIIVVVVVIGIIPCPMLNFFSLMLSVIPCFEKFTPARRIE
jgi:hypothetical protein